MTTRQSFETSKEKVRYSANMDHSLLLSPAKLLLVISGVSLIYLLSIFTHRLYFHRLSKFSGPWYAALTHWYQFYFDVVKRGRFPWELERMHR